MALQIVAFIIVPVVVVIAVTILAARRSRAKSADNDGDSMSFIGGVLSALFTIVLAFFVVFAWQNRVDLDGYSSNEADALVDTYWQVEVAPEPDATRIRDLLRQYATEVADREWELLASGDTDPRVSGIVGELRAAVIALPADSEILATAREKALENVRTVNENHRDRVDKLTTADTFTAAMLLGTIAGAVMMVVFPLLNGLSPRPANLATMILFTVTLGVTLFASWQLLNPLQGFFSASPDPFRDALAAMSAAAGT